MRPLPVGEDALLVEVDDEEQVQALYAELLRRRAAGNLPAAGEIVPAARTVLVTGLARPQEFARDLAGWHPGPAGRPQDRSVVIPVRYDGPDLPQVAAGWGMTVREAVGLHTSTGFRVAFCGFAPGFGYLTGLPAGRAVPRRDTPRTAVPAGSVALAGPYTGVYPRSSPGGWQIIGTTGAVLWDPGRDPAALLSPGTRVRFTEEER